MTEHGREPQRGVFIAIVGASGVGKDSIIRAIRNRLPEEIFYFPRRIVTRPPDEHEANLYVRPEEFEEWAARGDFALAWSANGHSYALPGSVSEAIEEGRHVVANLSRKLVPVRKGTFSRVLVVRPAGSAAAGAWPGRNMRTRGACATRSCSR
jgi:ribose 1,5-bisphosphokinase